MPETLSELFHRAAEEYAECAALMHKVDGEYQSMSYGELGERVQRFARGLSALGVQAEDPVAIIAENRPEWAVADLAIVSLGAVNVPLFISLSPSQIGYALKHSGSKVVIVSNTDLLARSMTAMADDPEVRYVVMDPPEPLPDRVMPFEGVQALADESPMTEAGFQDARQAVEPGDLASIIYTSGTTGEPKGVMLTHANFTSNVFAAQDVLRFGPDDTLLSFLPLNHVFERLAAYYLALSQGACVAYSEGARQLRDNIRETRPTMMLLVPRVYEVFQEAMESRVAKVGGLAEKLFHWSAKVGRERAAALNDGRKPSPWTRLKWGIARAVFVDKLHAAMGLDRLRFFVSGGAALPTETAWFFHSLGLSLLEGYGLTETSPVVSVNRPARFKIGTVGPPLKDVEVKISEAGEILVRGPNVMLGYFKRPEDTAEAIDADGWFHTGDMGQVDDDGYLRITDRLKSLIVLANGKNVAPQPLENAVKASPYIAQAVAVGDGRPTVAALIVPAFERVATWAREQDIEVGGDPSELAAHPQVRKLLKGEVERLTRDFAEYELIRRFAILDHDFSVEAGQLTPTLKVRRKVVAERYADAIKSLYGAD
ncbi:MAG: AMP-binding protein [Armatimonadia bacterium]|nr:AMP-binding protein [Armatimonadia bacterium]